MGKYLIYIYADIMTTTSKNTIFFNCLKIYFKYKIYFYVQNTFVIKYFNY